MLWAKAAISTLVSVYGAAISRADNDLALDDALSQSVSSNRYDASAWRQVVNHDQNSSPAGMVSARKLTGIAAVIYRGYLYVSYTGKNHALLLRNRKIRELTNADSERAQGRSKLHLQKGDRVVMCSDGLRQRVTEAEIAHILAHEGDPINAVAALMTTA